MVGPPLAQVRVQPLPSQRHFAVSLQVTVQAPAHSTPHSALVVQVTRLPAPALISQFALLLQATVAFAPMVRSQVELLAQVTVPEAPTVPAQVAPELQVNDAASPLLTMQLALLQIDTQPAPEQLWVHEPELHAHSPLLHRQPVPWHTGVTGGPQEEKSSARAREMTMRTMAPGAAGNCSGGQIRPRVEALFLKRRSRGAVGAMRTFFLLAFLSLAHQASENRSVRFAMKSIFATRMGCPDSSAMKRITPRQACSELGEMSLG